MIERVAIVGSREHPALEIVRGYVRTLGPNVTVISGGARGVDRVVEEEAIARGLWVRRYEAQNAFCSRVTFDGSARGRWDRHELDLEIRDRLLHRNSLIALDCTRMVVFPDGSKGGCWDAARQAVRFYRPVEVRWADGRVHAFDDRHVAPAQGVLDV